jgi:uncharacterized protein (TIGR03437 family)
LQIGQPQKVQLQISDDCGNPVTITKGGGGQVSIIGDDNAVDLTDVGGGIWEGTWTPVKAAPLVSLQAAAREQQLALGLPAEVTVTVVPATPNTSPQISAVVNAATGTHAAPQVVSPGTYVAIYGSTLASGDALAGSTPLPDKLTDTEAFIGGQPLPLIYAGSGQINALIPQNLKPNTSSQLIIQRGSMLSAASVLTIAKYQPGIYTLDLSGGGQGIVEIAGTTLIAAPTGEGSRPVSRSEYLVIFATGLGPVVGPNGEQPPADGAAAPITTVYQTTGVVSATIGGVDAPVLFSGLTPLVVGLYQINVQVPSAAAVGDAVPLTITVNDPLTGQGFQSNSVTIAVQ